VCLTHVSGDPVGSQRQRPGSHDLSSSPGHPVEMGLVLGTWVHPEGRFQLIFWLLFKVVCDPVSVPVCSHLNLREFKGNTFFLRWILEFRTSESDKIGRPAGEKSSAGGGHAVGSIWRSSVHGQHRDPCH
jgi:hypothetical protein